MKPPSKSVGLTPSNRTLIELELYKTQVRKLGLSVRTLDEALNLLTWALSKNPRAFDEVPGMPDCYVAKTEKWTTSGGIVVPAVRVFFRVKDENTVELAAICKIR